jgi:hypothetical protein
MAADHLPMTRTRAGLFIIRAWVEPGSSSPLRAQIHLTTDVAHGFERSLTLAQEEEIVEAVQAWLPEMLAGSHGADDLGNFQHSRCIHAGFTT